MKQVLLEDLHFERGHFHFNFQLPPRLAGSAKKKKNQKQREEEVGVSLYNLASWSHRLAISVPISSHAHLRVRSGVG